MISQKVKIGGRGGIRSRIFFAPSHKKFLDPGLRFRVLAKHRSALLIPTKAKQLAFSSFLTHFVRCGGGLSKTFPLYPV
jgi:hypothetical protein